MAEATKRVLASAALLSLAFGLGSGCGGQSFQEDGSSDDGESGDGGVSGTSSGGSGSGGASGSGASSTGGLSPAGGAFPAGGASPIGGAPPTGGVGTSGTAGAGGEPSICALPPDQGPCRGAFQRFAFDERTGLCLPFTYGGCEGNANNFEAIETCYMACGGSGTIDPASCGSPIDCTLVPSKCCGECNEATLSNSVAVRKGQESTVHAAMGCHLVDCVPCEPTAPNPWLGATCSAGRCVAYDLRQTGLVSCMDSSECVLRAGIECCENCSAGALEFVALNRQAELGSLACGDGPVACDACVPVPPLAIEPSCVSGRCDVLIHPI